MTLVAALICEDHTQLVADSGAPDEHGLMTYENEKVWRLGDYPLVWSYSGASWLTGDAFPTALTALPYDVTLPERIRRLVADLNARERRALLESLPIDLIGHGEGLAYVARNAGTQLVTFMVAGYWPERGFALYGVLPNGTGAFTSTPWHFIGAGAPAASVAYRALQVFQGADFKNSDGVLDAACATALASAPSTVAPPFRRWTITQTDVTASEWIEHLV